MCSLRAHACHAQIARRANLSQPDGIAVTPKSAADFARPAPERGALRDRHGRWARDAMDAAMCETNALPADGEVVWSWRPDAGVKFAGDDPANDGGKKARSPGRARNKLLKPSRGECRTLAVPVVTMLVWFFNSHARLWVRAAHPVFPAPSMGRFGWCTNSGVIRAAG
jgi:hypothetical protein